jgi:glycosyltransferase involved in cell wall biosynthesis
LRLLADADATSLAWLPGERGDIPELMRGFDLFALPSLGEGISNTILEAMATALPVVATRVGGNPELVTEGVTGALVPPADPAALAAALRAYVDDAALGQKHGANGRRRVEEGFSIDAMVAGYRAVYDSVLAGTPLSRGVSRAREAEGVSDPPAQPNSIRSAPPS